MAEVPTFHALFHTLPQELYDQIYELTFTVTHTTWPNRITIDKKYRFPSILQVNRQTRASLINTYYGTNAFWVPDLALFLSRMRPQGRVAQIRENLWSDPNVKSDWRRAYSDFYYNGVELRSIEIPVSKRGIPRVNFVVGCREVCLALRLRVGVEHDCQPFTVRKAE